MNLRRFFSYVGLSAAVDVRAYACTQQTNLRAIYVSPRIHHEGASCVIQYIPKESIQYMSTTVRRQRYEYQNCLLT